MTTYTYYPKGTCSKQMEVELEDGVIKDVRVLGGCNGNLQGISSLVRGMKAADAIERMRGIRCGFKPTSCPDQLSIALEKALEKEKNGEKERLRIAKPFLLSSYEPSSAQSASGVIPSRSLQEKSYTVPSSGTASVPSRPLREG